MLVYPRAYTIMYVYIYIMKVLYHLRPYFVVGISIFVRFLLRGHWFFGSKTLPNNAQQTSNHYPIWWKTIRMIIVMHIYILFLLLLVVIFIYYHYNSNNHYYYHDYSYRITVLVLQYCFLSGLPVHIKTSNSISQSATHLEKRSGARWRFCPGTSQLIYWLCV